MAQSGNRHRYTLLAIVAITAFTWLVLLPWIARQPEMKSHLSELDRQGIDGGAMYYTELEVMDRILAKLER